MRINHGSHFTVHYVKEEKNTLLYTRSNKNHHCIFASSIESFGDCLTFFSRFYGRFIYGYNTDIYSKIWEFTIYWYHDWLYSILYTKSSIFSKILSLNEYRTVIVCFAMHSMFILWARFTHKMIFKWFRIRYQSYRWLPLIRIVL